MADDKLTEQDLQSISRLRSAIPNPGTGLPDAVFDFALHVAPMINVDLFIEEHERVLLAWREDRWGAGWHVVGGIIRVQEAISDRIQRTAMGEIGVPVEFDAAPIAISQFFAERGHFISLLFRCRLLEPRPALWTPEDGAPSPGALAWFSKPPQTLYPAHVDYIPRLPTFSTHGPLGLGEPPIFLSN